MSSELCGHGIHDTDTNGLMEISGRKAYRTTIQNVGKRKAVEIREQWKEMIVYNRYNLLGNDRKKYRCRDLWQTG